MIVLDTNVVSEPFRIRADPTLRLWLDRQERHALFLCTPVLAELYYGVERLPSGGRRDRLAEWVRQVEEEFAERTLSFDRVASHTFGRVVAARDRLGRTIAPMDALIAAIALAHGAALATRNIEDFSDLGLETVNPFELI